MDLKVESEDGKSSHSFAIDAVNNFGNTALFESIFSNSEECFDLLIKLGSNPRWINDAGYTTLHVAIFKGNKKIANKLREFGLGVEDKDKKGRTVIFRAAQNGDIELFDYLVDGGADIWVKDKAGLNLLMMASINGNLAMMHKLLSLGFDIEEIDEYGYSAMTYAAHSDLEPAVTLLFRMGGDINANKSGKCTPLMAASSHASPKLLEKMLEFGAQIELKDKFGRTALLYASMHGKVDNLKVLERFGANLHALDNESWDALHFASNNSQIECIRYLVEKGFDIEARDKYGKTPLMYASINANEETVVTLLELGADPYKRDKSGMNSLEVANVGNNPQTAKYLYGIMKDKIGSDSKKPLLEKKNNLTFGVPFAPVMWSKFYHLMSAMSYVARKDQYGGWASPKSIIEAELRNATPLSTNIPYYDQKYYSVIQTFTSKMTDEMRGQQVGTLKSSMWLLGTFKARNLFDATSAVGLVSNEIKRAQKFFNLKEDKWSIFKMSKYEENFMLNLIRHFVKRNANRAFESSKFSGIIKEIKSQIIETYGEDITAEKARYSYPISNLDICSEFIMHAAATSNLNIIGAEKQSAIVVAAKNNRPDMMLAMMLGRMIRANSSWVVSKKHLNEALFWGVFHGNYTTVKACLEMGAKINAKPVLQNISSAELARHLGYRKVVELFAEKEGQTYEEYKNIDIPNIKERYTKVAISIAKKCYLNNEVLGLSYATLLTKRLLDGKYIGHQLRRILKVSDDISLVSINRKADLCYENSEVPELPREVIQEIKAKGINVALPKFNEELVSVEEIQQIYQELIAGNILGQVPNLSLERYGSGRESTTVELPEAFKNTLTGQTLIFTDQVQKQFWSDTIYFPPDKLQAHQHDFASLLSRERADDYNNYITEKSLPNSIDKSGYLKHVRDKFVEAGGIESEQMKNMSLAYQKTRAAFIKERGFDGYKSGGGRWKNCDFTMRVNGNTVYCEQGYRLFEDQIYFKGEQQFEFNDDEKLSTAQFLTDNVGEVPELAKFFELLKVVYSLQPIAQLAVKHGAIPDFGRMVIPKYTETPDDIIDYYHRSLYTTPENADLSISRLSEMLDEAGDNAISLAGGTAYTTSEYNKGVQHVRDNIQDEQIVICPFTAHINNDRFDIPPDDPRREDLDYRSDSGWKGGFHDATKEFFGLKGSGGVWVTDKEGLDEFYEKYPEGTEKQYRQHFQMIEGEKKRENEVAEISKYVRKEVESGRAWIPESRANANTRKGPGSGKQFFARDPRVEEYESILEEVDEPYQHR